MSDYFHYRYTCPYMSSTTGDKVVCQEGSRICFPSVASCRRYVQQYCAGDEWENCSIARVLNDCQLRKIEIQKEVKSWTTKKRK